MTISRRDFLKITAIANAAGLGTIAYRQLLNMSRPRKISETYTLMGTIVNFVLVAESEELARDAIQKTVTEMKRLIQIHDYRRADSPLAQLNAEGRTHQTSPELIATFRQALRFGQLSQGAFDITVKPLVDALRNSLADIGSLKSLVDYRLLDVREDEISLARAGMAVTLDGIAKGKVVDGGISKLSELGFENVLVEAGGDMMAKGNADDQPWKIGIAHPRRQNEYIARISVQDQAVATSGDYINYFSSDYSTFHIIDPRTGRSPSQLASATVIAPSVAEADALSTTMMVLGVQAGLDMIEQLPQTAALLVTKDLKMYPSRQFPIL